MGTDDDTEGRQYHGTLPQHEAAAMRLLLALDGGVNEAAITFVLEEVMQCQACAAATLMFTASLGLTALHRWDGWQLELTERLAFILDAMDAARAQLDDADSP